MRSMMMTLITLLILYTKKRKDYNMRELINSILCCSYICLNKFFFHHLIKIIFLFRKNKKATSLLSNTSLTITAAQHCRCYSQSSSPPYSVLIFSAVDILFRLIEAFVGQVEVVQKNCFRKVRKKIIKKKVLFSLSFFFLPLNRLWAHANRIKKTHQFSTVIDHAVNNQHLQIYLQINNKNHLILLHLIVIKPQKPVVFVGVAVVRVHGMYIKSLL